jgi:glycosyltransferase involved in cell wall biosynthesis
VTGRLRVAVIADYLEESWPSMDLVADMIMAHLCAEHASTIDATLVRPPMPRRFSRLPQALVGTKPSVVDRALARQWDYARRLRRVAGFDVYHVVDHTYANLVHQLPSGRAVVTCHDVDAFRSVLEPEAERRSLPYRWMSRRILDGLRRAAHVMCDSDATRDALVRLAAFPADRLSVIRNGADATGWSDSGAASDLEAGRLLGPPRRHDLLHVGSTIARKRIDLLIDIFAAVRAAHPDARLIRAGGQFTAEQRVRARDLGLLDAIVVLPFVDRATLSAIYRRAAVTLLPSEREGFGLPLVETLACGTPVVASDIPVLREIGGSAASYAPLDDVPAWRDTVLGLFRERDASPEAWQARREAARARAADFSWSRYTSQVAEVYAAIARGERVTATAETGRTSAAGEPARAERGEGPPRPSV